MQSSGYRTLQTILGLAALPLAVWPLVQYLLDREQNRLFRTLFGDPTGSARWLIPVAILVVIGVICIVLDELAKRADRATPEQ